MDITKIINVLFKHTNILFVLIFLAGSVHAQEDVTYNEGAITGTVRIGTDELTRVTIQAVSGSLHSSQTFYPGSDTTSINYSLPVNVPTGDSLDYHVQAIGIQLVGGNRVNFPLQTVTVSDGGTAVSDFVIDNPGFIEGNVTVVGAELSYALLYFDGNSILYRGYAYGGGNAGHFRVAVAPGTLTLGGSTQARLTDLRSLRLTETQTVMVSAGETTILDINFVAPAPATVKGDITMPGPVVADIHRCELTGNGFGWSEPSPCEWEVFPGRYTFRAKSSFNNSEDYFIHPYASYSSGSNVSDVAPGAVVEFDVSSDQAFINGGVNFSGTASNADLSQGSVYVYGSSAQSHGGSSYDYGLADGEFDLIVSPGDWKIQHISASFERDDAADYLNSSVSSLTFGPAYLPVMSVSAGDTADLDTLEFPLGSVVVNFTAEDGATFSNPSVSRWCEKVNSQDEYVLGYQVSASNPTAIDVTEAQVTFVGPAATCTRLRAEATVNGARVTFGEFDVTVIPTVVTTVDLGAPTLTVQYPEPNLITSNPTITVSGKVTDNLVVESTTVNGEVVVLQPTGNADDEHEVSFATPVNLVRGPNTIVTVARDVEGNTVSDTRIVYRDEALPTVVFTPGDETVAPSFDVVGVADDDAGVADVKVNGTSVATTSTGNSNSPNEVAYSVSMSLPLGDHFIKVTVTDISNRTTTVVHKVTVADNRPPVANAGSDQTLVCSSVLATDVTLNGTGSSDPDGDPLNFNWMGNFGTTSGEISIVSLPLGITEIGLIVDDGSVSGMDSLTVQVDVEEVGLLPPLADLVPEGSEPAMPKKAFKHGRVLPLKLQMACGGVALTDVDVAAPKIIAITPQGGTPIDLVVIDPDAGEANDSGLLFRNSESNWIYNLNTKDLMPGTIYDITIELPDGRRMVSRIPFK